MPQDLLAPQAPRDLLADTAPAPAPKPSEDGGGVTGAIGDWIIDNAVGGVSEDMLENARRGTFKQDAGEDKGLFDFLGSKIERGGANVDAGLYRLLGALGSPKAREAAEALERGTVGQRISGDVESYKDVDGLGSAGRYAAGLTAESTPFMGMLAIPWVGPTMGVASETGNIAQERAQNDGNESADGTDLLRALPFAGAAIAAERFGLKGITNPVGNTVVGRIGSAAAREGVSEGLSTTAQYAGGTYGTERGGNWSDYGDQLAEGIVGGGVMGGTMRTGAEIAAPVYNKVKPASRPQPVAGSRDEGEQYEGSLDDLLRGEQDQQPQDLLALPSPEMVQRQEVERQVEPAPATDMEAVKAAIRGPESGGDDTAVNRAGSSASGRYQFIESTFKNYYQRVYGVNSAMADQAWQKRRFDPEVQERLMDAMLADNLRALSNAGFEPDTGNLYLAHFAGPGKAVELLRANPDAPVSQFFSKQAISQNETYLGGGKTVAQALETIRGKVGGAGTGATSSVPDAAAIDIPGADGSLLGRGDGERIANLDIPEASAAQREAGKATPIELPSMDAQTDGAQTDIPAPALIAPLPPARATGNASQVTTARGEMVDTQFELRDLSELIPSSSPNYDQSLQPRDRASRGTSDAQVTSIAANLDPAQLGDSRLASTGAPIIGPDGQVESGNGRVSAIARAYQTNPERAQAYRQMIEGMGIKTGGLQYPVLVRRRTTDMTPEQRQAWTRAANERDTMAMSSTEQASADARALDDVTLGMYRGGAVTAAANRDFVRAFIQKAVSPAERNAMTAADGSISADGVRRVRFALLARAYGDTELISRISEDTDTNIAAIGKALLEAAPAMARMKAKIASGDIPAQYDISTNIAEAARMVSRSRESGQSIAGMLAQTDAFSEAPAPATVEVLRTFFRDEAMKRPRSGQKVADILVDYAREVDALGERAKQGDDMFGNAPQMPPPAEVLRDQRELLDGGRDGQRDLLTNPPEAATSSQNDATDQPSRQTAGTTEPAANGQDRGAGSPVLARGQLRGLGIARELQRGSTAALLGRPVYSANDLAEIAQIYRDPRVETFRMFFTKDNRIVHATGVSSRLASEAPLMPEGMTDGEWIMEMRETMKRAGADGYYMLHNHPSGDPIPSQADRDVTREITALLPGFQGHVVINSGKYSVIGNDGRYNMSDIDIGEDQLLKPSIEHRVIGQPLKNYTQLAVVAKGLQKEGMATLVAVDAKGNIRAILDYDPMTLDSSEKTLAAISRRVQRNSGAERMVLIGQRSDIDHPVVKRALRDGMLMAAIDEKGGLIDKFKSGKKRSMPEAPGRAVAEGQASFGDTIEIDGVARSTVNSEGQPLAQTEEGVRAFWAWFGDSKVVDAQGRPLVVYHGAPDARDITSEDGSFKSLDQRFGGDRQGVHWFAKSRATARSYADDRRAFDYQAAEPAIVEAYLRIENPEDVSGGGKEWRIAQARGRTSDVIQEAQASGRDGVIIRNVLDNYNVGGSMTTTYSVFSDKQIKSVNNRGTFSPDDARILREQPEPFDPKDPRGNIIDKLVDTDGMKRDAQAIRDAVGNPLKVLKGISEGSMADMGRSFFYSMDSRMRAMAKRYNSPTINKLANMFHAEAGKTDEAVGETYHEAVEREGFGRASRAWRILAPFFEDKDAMNRIGMMLRNPGAKTRGPMAEAKAAQAIAKLLKDTIDYRKEAGEDIGEVTDGYFPRWMDVEKVMSNRDLFLRQATELYKKHSAENPEASAKAWMARIFDQYAGLDGGIAYAGLFRDTRPAGVGRKTTKEREFGKDADRLLGEFYSNDAGEVLTAYFIGAAKKAEEARRFGDDKLERMMNQIKREMRASDQDAGDALDALAKMIDTNLGRTGALGEKMRSATSLLHTAGQLGTLDRATVTSLSEAMMGFVRAGPKYGIPMMVDSVREFVRNIRGQDPSQIARLAEALGIIEDVMVGDTLAARAGYERSQTTNRSAKIQRGFFQATGLHQWTEGTRAAATRMGQAFIRNNAEDALLGKGRADENLRELGIKNPKAFAQWLSNGGDISVDGLTSSKASPEQEQYRSALMRFVNQTIMKPTKAQKPRWASTPYGALIFSLMSFSYGFKKNVLDRTGRVVMKGIKEKDPTLLYPAFGLAGLLAAHTVINNVLRQAVFGGGREDDEEGIGMLDVAEAIDRAGLTGAASRPLNALWSLRYRQGIIEAMMGPVIGRPADLLEKTFSLATDANSDNTNTAERAAAGAVYDVVLEPALEAYGVTRFKKPLAAAVVWSSGNREGGALPADRDYFVDALAGEKPD